MENNTLYLALKPFFKFLPYAGSYLIILGLCEQLYYYYGFGISIVSYVNITEVVVAFLDKIITTISFSLLLLILIVIADALKIMLEKRGDKVKFSGVVLFAGYLCYCFFLAFLPLVTHFTTRYLFNGVIYFLMFATIYYVFIYNKKLLAGFPPHTGLLLFFLTFGFAHTFYSAKQKFIKVTQDKKNNGVVVVLDSITIKSDSSVYFIGKTNDFIFLYNEKHHSTIVFPMERVRELQFINKRSDWR